MTGAVKRKKTKRDPKNWIGRGTPYFPLDDPRENEEHLQELKRLNPGLKLEPPAKSSQRHASRPANMEPNMNPDGMGGVMSDDLVALLELNATVSHGVEAQHQYSQYPPWTPQQSSQQSQHSSHPTVVAPLGHFPSAAKFKADGTSEAITSALPPYPSPAQSYRSGLNQLTQSYQPLSIQNGQVYQSLANMHGQTFQPQQNQQPLSFQTHPNQHNQVYNSTSNLYGHALQPVPNQFAQSFQPRPTQNGQFYQLPSNLHTQTYQSQLNQDSQSAQPLSNQNTQSSQTPSNQNVQFHQPLSSPQPRTTPVYLQYDCPRPLIGMEPPQHASKEVVTEETIQYHATPEPAEEPSQKPAPAVITEQSLETSSTSSVQIKETDLSTKSPLASTLHPEATISWYKNVHPVTGSARKITRFTRELLQKGFNLTDLEFDIVEERMCDLLYQNDNYRLPHTAHDTWITHFNIIKTVKSELKPLLGKHGIPAWWKSKVLLGWLGKCLKTLRDAGNKAQDSIQRRKMRILQAQGAESGMRKAADLARKSAKKVIEAQYSQQDDDETEELEDEFDGQKVKQKGRFPNGKSGGRTTRAKRLLDSFASEDESPAEASDVPPPLKKQKTTTTKAKKAPSQKVVKKPHTKVVGRKSASKPRATQITTQPPPGQVPNRQCHFHIVQRNGNLSELISLSDILKPQSPVVTDPSIDFDLEQLDFQRLKGNLIQSGMMKVGVDRLFYDAHMGDRLHKVLIARQDTLVKAAHYLKIPGQTQTTPTPPPHANQAQSLLSQAPIPAAQSVPATPPDVEGFPMSSSPPDFNGQPDASTSPYSIGHELEVAMAEYEDANDFNPTT
ncbi:hypothetical protein BJ875DRAFT_526556 [Amylocarpus encephaloides]|uniref:Uncharacterized protein n=1 Tax=Amylocarpus encephaloides TaxID=45428 RepID=A0A9P7YNC4_9HELO|nr:hypothetical protein BJ875DRAFT_526556 [Amylocarpus encephaloides]